MASEYSVNIKLNTSQVKRDLKTIGDGIGNLGKKQARGTKSALSDAEEALKVKITQLGFDNKILRIQNKLGVLTSKNVNQEKVMNHLNDAQLKSNTKQFSLAKQSILLAQKEIQKQKETLLINKGIEDSIKKQNLLRGRPTGFSAAEYGPRLKGAGEMQGPRLPPITSSALNFDRKTGRLLQGPAGSSRNTRQNLLRRFGPTRGFDFGSAAISGGFPLLFGQGPLGALAGGLGGGIGGMFGQMGGFAGGIAATAAVTSIQNAINGIGELGQAMNRLNPNISAMSQAMGIAGTVEEKRLQLIEKNLGKQAAFNAALEMLGEKIGADQAEELRKFGETFQRLGNEVTLFFTKVQAAIAKLLNQALDAGADANLRGRARDLVSQNPNNPAFRDVNQRIKEIQSRETTGRTGAKEKQDDLRAAKAERLEIAKTVILEKDRDKLRVKNNKLITAGLGDLEKENQLSRAIIAGKEEEFLVQEAIKNKAEEMGLVFADLEVGQQNRIANTVKQNRALKDQAEIAKDIQDAFDSLSTSINNDIKEGIKGLIKGTSTLGDLLNNVADRFLDVALNQALFGSILGSEGKKGGGIFGALGLFANGGRPPVGKPSIVGEKGPELFVPRSSGTIVPNNKLGGGGSTSVVVNVDASGSDVQGDDAGAKELGTLISVAVQGELLKQQRPGGLLSSLR